jgi:hypothetical protein
MIATTTKNQQLQQQQRIENCDNKGSTIAITKDRQLQQQQRIDNRNDNKGLTIATTKVQKL